MPLSELNAGQCTVHGTLVSVAGVGILLKGPAGIGKSACTLDLIAGGHQLVADDVVEVEAIETALVGTAPERFYGLLEVRGLGICDVRQLYGADSSSIRQQQIDVCVEFLAASDGRNDSLAALAEGFDLLGVSLPRVSFIADGTRSARVFVEAVAKFFSCRDNNAAPRLIAEHDLLTRSAADG
jgi:HPr kinase/phosphorylase